MYQRVSYQMVDVKIIILDEVDPQEATRPRRGLAEVRRWHHRRVVLDFSDPDYQDTDLPDPMGSMALPGWILTRRCPLLS